VQKEVEGQYNLIFNFFFFTKYGGNMRECYVLEIVKYGTMGLEAID
jgi:hypothetical protein